MVFDGSRVVFSQRLPIDFGPSNNLVLRPGPNHTSFWVCFGVFRKPKPACGKCQGKTWIPKLQIHSTEQGHIGIAPTTTLTQGPANAEDVQEKILAVQHKQLLKCATSRVFPHIDVGSSVLPGTLPRGKPKAQFKGSPVQFHETVCADIARGER